MRQITAGHEMGKEAKESLKTTKQAKECLKTIKEGRETFGFASTETIKAY